ncbi:MAG: Zn-dependent hydrolase [Roseiflexaceae bacterium]|nr:Zn-dependent hydrolase [Roseiflexaceae bacterium]
MVAQSTLNPARTIAELKQLRALTGDMDGAQRVAWTSTWAQARAWFREKLAELPIEIATDQAGNVWATLRGESEHALIIGSHLDSVPNGGWLDGCLGELAGLEVLRRIAAQGRPPVTVRLVDWADEEGARFGRSLVGSSAFSGTIDPEELAELVDRDGITLPDALKAHGVDLMTAKQASVQQKYAAAYLELHIEQGPVLEGMGLPLGVVIGTFGVERHRIIFGGQAAHAGSTPMNKRRDAFAAAAKLGLAIRTIATNHGGVCTVGSCVTKPGIVTAVVGECTITLDQRHMEAAKLAVMLQDAKNAAARFAEEEQCTVVWERIWRIDPIPFDPALLDLAEQAVRETSGSAHRLPSGPLHDAAETARAGIPTVMLFVQSLRGISHNKIEDTDEQHLALAVEALDRLASKAMAQIAAHAVER